MAKSNPTAPHLTEQDILRFWSYVDKSGGPEHCWPWKLKPMKNGYGQFHASRTLRAHRVALYLASGQWPSQSVCHACDVPLCCNPKHLWEGTDTENIADRDRKGRGRVASGPRHGLVLHPERVSKGSNHYRAQLSEDLVLAIRSRYAKGVRQYVLADEFGLPRRTVHKIVHRQSWKHV